MASLELFCAIPFPTTSVPPSNLSPPLLSSSINLSLPLCLCPARLCLLPSALPCAPPRPSFHCYSNDGISIDLEPDELKSQLEALQTEAERARCRANTARARFMRLTETVENLRLRAALDVKAGREENARKSLLEKQKVIKALEKSKQRAELLDELSVKLGEAISRKETQLIKSLSSSKLKMNEGGNDVPNVRVVFPKIAPVADVISVDTGEFDTDNQSTEEECQNSVIQDASEISNESGSSNTDCPSNDAGYENVDKGHENSFMQSTEPDVIRPLFGRIDDQLCEIEIELHNLINIAAMPLSETIDNTTNAQVASVKELWHDIRNIRLRIQTMVKET